METIQRLNRMVPGYVHSLQLHGTALTGNPAAGCRMDSKTDGTDAADRSIHLIAWHLEIE
jgi:hypothetical protein